MGSVLDGPGARGLIDGVRAKLMAACLCALMLGAMACAQAAPPESKPVVVLLHGLARSPASMKPMATALEAAGFRICNLAYPSRKFTIAVLTTRFLAPAITECAHGAPVNFVTHSLGGILVRQLRVSSPEITIARVVMLSPPNHGSEIVDKLGAWWLYRWINGPAGGELGTDSGAVPPLQGAPDFDLGVLTGRRSINWILSTLIPGPDDGKVSVNSAKLHGMRDFRVLSSSHPFIMRNPRAIAESIHFLRHGVFSPAQSDRLSGF